MALVRLVDFLIHANNIKKEIMNDMANYLSQYSTPEPFNCNTSSEENMRKRCRELAIPKEYEDFCVMAFVLKLRRKDISEQTGYPIGTVKNYITKYRKKLEGYKTV